MDISDLNNVYNTPETGLLILLLHRKNTFVRIFLKQQRDVSGTLENIRN